MIHTSILLALLTLCTVCYGQHLADQTPVVEGNKRPPIGRAVPALGKNIGSMLQDSRNNYWFASNGEGVFYYDGMRLVQITDRDGLCGNFVRLVKEDVHGKIWFTTSDGVCCYDGQSIIDYTARINTAPPGIFRPSPGDLFFGRPDGMCVYNGKSFTSFAIHPVTYFPSPNDINRPYSVYSTLVDREGSVWFGTQERGVCRFDGARYTYFTAHGLDKAAVRTLFQDRSGNIWAGNNGAGLFRYTGVEFVNVTDEHGLANPGFLKKLGAKEGTLARPWTMAEDETGTLLIGSIDAGLWKYDGRVFTNYTTKDGLPGNSIWTISKDRQGRLWFVVGGEEIGTFNGKTFTRFTF